MAQIPILRKKSEGGEDFLLALTITHPTGPEGPTVNFKWDKDWVDERRLPPAFAQQICLLALQALFAGALVIGQGVVVTGPPLGQKD